MSDRLLGLTVVGIYLAVAFVYLLLCDRLDRRAARRDKENWR